MGHGISLPGFLSLLLLLIFNHQPANGFVQPFRRATKPADSSSQSRTLHNHHHHPTTGAFSLLKQTNSDSNSRDVRDKNRRTLWTKKVVQFASGLIGATGLFLLARPVWAASRSRTDGYVVQKTEREWKELLSPIQYEVLRKGGTERPGFSILEIEKRPGEFRCAGCGTALFDTKDKFNSGTGWPSFARALPGVEVEDLNPVMAQFSGAELRCQTCGGHLGDVFQDGFVFPGTEAAKTGKRFCIDGAALVFYPAQSDEVPLRGDVPKQAKKEMPSWMEPPRIQPRDS